MLSMVMQMQLSGFEGFTDNQKSNIISVSQQCSYFYSEPVFLARSLRSTFDDAINDYSDDCMDIVPIQTRSDKREDIVNIYPNPASETITIEIQDNSYGEFEIVSSIGQVMDVIKIKGRMILNISEYPAGVYFLKDKENNVNL